MKRSNDYKIKVVYSDEKVDINEILIRVLKREIKNNIEVIWREGNQDHEELVNSGILEVEDKEVRRG